MRKQAHHTAAVLAKVVENPYLNVIVGLILLITGISEAGGALIEDISNLDLGAHHGIIVFGFIHMFKSLSAILIGLAFITHNGEQEE